MRAVNVIIRPSPPVVSGGGGSVRKVIKKVILDNITTVPSNPLETVSNYFDNSVIAPVELANVPEDVTLPIITEAGGAANDQVNTGTEARVFVPSIMSADMTASSTEEIRSLYSAAISSANLHTFGSWWTGLFAIIDGILIIIYFKKKKI